MEQTAGNAEQRQYWNEQAGPKWVALQDLIDVQIRPLGQRAMDRAALAHGEHVLDVGCGCGDSSLELARRVGATGSVTGLDISAVMLERARARAEAANLAHARFEATDVQTHDFEGADFDVVFSRFGVMFFSDPVAAFTNLRGGLRPGGRLAFVCWQALPENPWMFVPLMAALQHMPPPPIPDPNAPGPFAFADPDRVRGILDRAGFTNIGFEPTRETLTVGGGGDIDQTVDFLLQMGPTSRALGDADPALVAVVAGAVRESLAPYTTPTGVQMPSAAWIVTARRA